VVDVGDRHRAHAVVAWAREATSDRYQRLLRPESPGLSQFWTSRLLGEAQEQGRVLAEVIPLLDCSDAASP
jgi:hypothetical protein